MGKLAKEHRKKIQARNNKIKQEKSNTQKMQRDFIMNMIKKEQEKGMFENNLDINQNIDIKDINSIIEGPSI
jgi:hypothetical protein